MASRFFSAVALVIFVGQNFLPSGRLGGRNGLTIPISQEIAGPASGTYKEMSTSGTFIPDRPSDAYLNRTAGSDNREFLKFNYNATVQTRRIESLVSKITITVHGLGGRIDSSSSGDRYGYVNFSLPLRNFEILKQAVKDLVPRKLLLEQIDSANLLPEKQIIEWEKSEAEQSLATLKNEKSQLNSGHTQTVNVYNQRLTALGQEKDSLENEWTNASAERRAAITTRLAQIQTEKNLLQADLEKENQNYRNKLSSLNNQIKNVENSLQNIQKRDENFMDDLSMISGTIYFDWISFWKLANLFVPGTIIPWLFLIGAIIAFWRYRISRKVLVL